MADQRRGWQALAFARAAGNLDFDDLSGAQGFSAIADGCTQQHGLAGGIDGATNADQFAADIAIGQLDDHAFRQRCGEIDRCLNFQPER